MDKNLLRKEAGKRIAGCCIKEESAMIVQNLLSLGLYNEAKAILAFMPLSDEPDITQLLLDKRILLPYIEGKRMHFSASKLFHRGAFGIKEPEHIEAEYDKALMLVPLLGYSPALARLGRGGGFYDRYIEANRERITTIGLAFSNLCMEDFLPEPHDAILDMVITPAGVKSAGNQALKRKS